MLDLVFSYMGLYMPPYDTFFLLPDILHTFLSLLPLFKLKVMATNAKRSCQLVLLTKAHIPKDIASFSCIELLVYLSFVQIREFFSNRKIKVCLLSDPAGGVMSKCVLLMMQTIELMWI